MYQLLPSFSDLHLKLDLALDPLDWEPKQVLPLTLFGHGSVSDGGTQYLYVLGGYTDFAAAAMNTQVRKYDTVTDGWTALTGTCAGGVTKVVKEPESSVVWAVTSHLTQKVFTFDMDSESCNDEGITPPSCE